MDSTLYRTPLACTRLGCRIVCTLDLYDISLSILYDLLALDDISIFQTNFSVRLEAKILLRRLLHEVVSLYIDLACKRNLA